MIPGHLSHRKCASGSNFTKHGPADKTSDKCTRCRVGSETKKIYFLKMLLIKSLERISFKVFLSLRPLMTMFHLMLLVTILSQA
jgi:hypothetical protein